MLRRTMMLTAVLVLGTAAAARAANDTLATAWQTVLGQQRSQSLVAGGVGYYGLNLSADRSYAVFCWEPFLESQGAASGFCNSDIRNNADTVVSNSSGSEPYPKGGAIHTLTPTVSGFYYIRLFNSGAFGSGTQTVNFIVIETTLASPWYFVVAGSYEAFAEIRNNTNASVSATVRAYTAAGAIAGSTTLSVGANGTALVLVSSLGVTTGSGSVTITHNAMPGAITGNITTLGVAAGLSFDAPFTPRISWSTF